MEIRAYKLQRLCPPKDDLFSALTNSKFTVKDGDIVAVSSKVMSIHEGRTLPSSSEVNKDQLAKVEAEKYIERPRMGTLKPLFTISRKTLISVSGIDESNANGHFILYPKDPMKSARNVERWIKKTYKVSKIGVIITDSRSVPLRRGAIGFALSYSGFNPLKDYRDTKDIFGRNFTVEVANIADSLAAAAVLEMGEGAEQTPVATISNAQNVQFTAKTYSKAFFVKPEEDLFNLFWRKMDWKKGGFRK